MAVARDHLKRVLFQPEIEGGGQGVHAGGSPGYRFSKAAIPRSRP